VHATAHVEADMRKHLRKPWVWVAAIILLALWLLWPQPVSSPPVFAPAPASGQLERDAGALPDFLPPEARATVRLIERGGPFPHRQDGSVFGNRERLLPQRPRGYYREYTVATPGLSHRGARRIVAGGDPPEVWYYTDDHYNSFRAFALAAPRSR
jgi:guanyl-specific ribonuclease Sa